MMLVRPVQPKDLDALMALARKTGVGFTSLQPDEAQLSARIERCRRTLQGTAEWADQGYLFILEDSATARVVGVSAIEVAVGLREPWYNFRLGTLTHACGALGVHTQMPTLFLSNDHTGHSELCTLFLDPDWRVACNGSLLSKSRLLFMAAFRQRFAARLVAEMRGVSDAQGRSPFWESLGRHFFNMDFAKADALSGLGNKAFIAELMPKHPLYVAFLTAEARAVIGRVHPQTEPARALLEAEGLRYEGYVDIFDGGATLEGYVEDLRIVRDSRVRLAVRTTAPAAAEAPLYLVSNEREDDFRVILAPGNDDDGPLPLSDEAFDALRLTPDAPVRSVILSRPRPGVTA